MKWIDTRAGLEDAAGALRGAKSLFVDTEFDSNRGGTDLCVLQVADGREIYLFDALRLDSLAALSPAFEAAEWVLHAGLQDVDLVSRRLDLEQRPRVFDTQVAWSLLSVEYSVSLAYLQYRVLGVRGGKGYQADDWRRRPLPEAQLRYAASDVEHLPALYRELSSRLCALGREEMAREASAETIWPAPNGARSALTLDSFRNAWQLDRPSQAALTFLIGWYNQLDEEQRAYAPEPKTLLAIASRLPESTADLMRIKGVPRRFASEDGARLISGLKRARAAAGTAEFREIEPPPYATPFELRLDGWLAAARAEVCAELGVAPELVLSARVVKVVRSLLLAGKSLEDALAAIGGFRQALLSAPLREFATRLPPPEPEG